MLSSAAKLHILYILYAYFVRFLCIFNTHVPKCGATIPAVAGVGAGFIVVASPAARAASNERRRSEERASKQHPPSSAVSRQPSAVAHAVAVSRRPLPSAVASRRDLRPAGARCSPSRLRSLRAVVSLFVALSPPLSPLRARVASPCRSAYSARPEGRRCARSRV